MQSFLHWSAIGFAGGIVFACFFEWTLHRYVMHRPLWKLVYPFRSHAQIHHHVFKADASYHLLNDADKKTIPMAWWNGPAIVATGMIPVSLLCWVTGHWGLAIGAVLAFSSYYATYEYIHWCMHLPKARREGKSWLFYRLNGHHLLHHRYMHRNFNVVFPLADFCLGTLLLRSRIPFPQPRGPAVPDVQPLPSATGESKPALPQRARASAV